MYNSKFQLRKLNITTIYQDAIFRGNTYSLIFFFKKEEEGFNLLNKLLMIKNETEKECKLRGAIRYIIPIYICNITLLKLSMYFLHQSHIELTE